jgi:hypothetical protein
MHVFIVIDPEQDYDEVPAIVAVYATYGEAVDALPELRTILEDVRGRNGTYGTSDDGGGEKVLHIQEWEGTRHYQTFVHYDDGRVEHNDGPPTDEEARRIKEGNDRVQALHQRVGMTYAGSRDYHDAIYLCPDKGTCHHGCTMQGGCYRVNSGLCGPLSNVYPGDRWPEEVEQWHESPESRAALVERVRKGEQ